VEEDEERGNGMKMVRERATKGESKGKKRKIKRRRGR